MVGSSKHEMWLETVIRGRLLKLEYISLISPSRLKILVFSRLSEWKIRKRSVTNLKNFPIPKKKKNNGHATYEATTD
jgi:hypothetical protein